MLIHTICSASFPFLRTVVRIIIFSSLLVDCGPFNAAREETSSNFKTDRQSSFGPFECVGAKQKRHLSVSAKVV
jgi:hypothetical protein